MQTRSTAVLSPSRHFRLAHFSTSVELFFFSSFLFRSNLLLFLIFFILFYRFDRISFFITLQNGHGSDQWEIWWRQSSHFWEMRDFESTREMSLKKKFIMELKEFTWHSWNVARFVFGQKNGFRLISFFVFVRLQPLPDVIMFEYFVLQFHMRRIKSHSNRFHSPIASQRRRGDFSFSEKCSRQNV